MKAAEELRNSLKFVGDRVPIIRLLEIDLSGRCPGFDFEVCDNDTWDGDDDEEAYVCFAPSPTMFLREHVYTGAVKGDRSAIFTIAHEIAHVLLHRNIAKRRFARMQPGERAKTHAGSKEEQEANAFASSLLAPRSQISEWMAISEIKMRYGVSHQVAQRAKEEAEEYGRKIRNALT